MAPGLLVPWQQQVYLPVAVAGALSRNTSRGVLCSEAASCHARDWRTSNTHASLATASQQIALRRGIRCLAVDCQQFHGCDDGAESSGAMDDACTQLRVGVICGGPSEERGISLNSARSAVEHLGVSVSSPGFSSPAARLWTSDIWLERLRIRSARTWNRIRLPCLSPTYG